MGTAAAVSLKVVLLAQNARIECHTAKCSLFADFTGFHSCQLKHNESIFFSNNFVQLL